MRRAALLVCLALLLAGCNGPLGGGGTATPASTATPTATSAGPTTPTPTPPPDPADVGLAADGVVDAEALATAHERRLGETSYTLGASVVVRGPNRTTVLRSRRVVRVAPGGDRFAWNGSTTAAGDAPTWLTRAFGSNGTARAFSNDSATVVSLTGDDWSDSYVSSDGQEGQYFLQTQGSLTARPVVEAAFAGVDTRVRSIDRDGDAVLFALAATDGPHEFEVAGVPDGTTEVTSLSATVQRSGIVRELSMRYVVETPDGRYTVRRVLTVVDVGETTVERPGWVATVPGVGPPGNDTTGAGS